ncbi:MAG: TIGR02757 family protein [Bacteroidales bacterium]|nr:TIGR02757 family protein [Bacteroidales bacterium]
MDRQLLKDFLEEKYHQYNNRSFIETDPVQVPHMFSEDADKEIAAFLTSTISWGRRTTIISNAKRLMKMMGYKPFEFMMNATEHELKQLSDFKHRTFNGADTLGFIRSLRAICSGHGSLKGFFEKSFHTTGSLKETIIMFRSAFVANLMLQRTHRHISDITRNASAKRLNLFIRWMVRNDKMGVDFGTWDKIPASALYIPLDVHTGNVSRALGLLKRRQNDWKAVEELTATLRSFDPDDPVKYDYALFGLGVFENFNTL